MITLHLSGNRSETPADLSAAGLGPEAIWIDLLNPDAAEISFVERATGMHVPRFDELSEIESSSRLRTEAGAIYLSTPIVFRSEGASPLATPVGFVLTRERLITVRFQKLTPFAAFLGREAEDDMLGQSGPGVFVGLMEAIVDRMADLLEKVAADLDSVSQVLFRLETNSRLRKLAPAREDANLREHLRSVGRSGDLISKIRDSLLGTGRIVPYVSAVGAPWMPPQVVPRLQTIQRDVASLNDYELHLANKVQLMLDATLGLINIEQNNIIKVLTIVSVVGVPPTLVASMYGTNFKYMPELGWHLGYPFGLALIALSAVVPLLWFKLRGWL